MDDSNLVFSDLTFKVAAAPQYQSLLVTTLIPEDPTIKSIFAAAGVWMKMSDAATPSDINTITIDIPKY